MVVQYSCVSPEIFSKFVGPDYKIDSIQIICQMRLLKKKKEKEIQNINVTSFHYAKQNYGD